MLINFFLGWEEADASTYAECFMLYGGNASAHPDLLDLQHKLFRIPHRFMIKADSMGIPIAAVCVWAEKYIANDSATTDLTRTKSLPISRDELLLPIQKNSRLILPFKSKILSPLHCGQAMNTTYKWNAKRRICIAKRPSEFSSKTRQTRQREIKKFVESGGEIRSISNFCASDAMDIYDALFLKRRGVNTKDIELNKNLFREHPGNFFGGVLFHDGEPCAMQIIVKSETKNIICFDYINIGYDTRYKGLCLGTVLTWLNLKQASEICAQKEKIMRFSFGKPTFEYKSRWCNYEPLGRVITF